MSNSSKKFSYYYMHDLTFRGKSEKVQCRGADCPLCGMWQEQQEVKKNKPKTPNLLDKVIVGLGKHSFARSN